MSTLTIEIAFPSTKEEFVTKAKESPIAAAEMLDQELAAFNQCLAKKNLSPMQRFEQQIVLEYLAYKVLGEF
jgi:hypothetical protein